LLNRQQIADALDGTKLAVATPAYGGQVTVPYLQSLTAFTRLATSLPLTFDLLTSMNESLVTRARNRLVRLFLDSDATHLLFIDADIGFDPYTPFRLLLHNQPVVCGSYPMKGVAWDQLVGQTITSPDQARELATVTVTNFDGADSPLGATQLRTEGPLVAVKDAGTGFMCIRRDVIETMVDRLDVAYTSDDPSLPGTWHAIFDCAIRDGRYLSEDYMFCRRWQDLGGTVWLDPAITLDHVGTFTFQGVPSPVAELIGPSA
jgi:hypothetical protein